MIDNNTEEQIRKILDDELSEYDYSTIASEEEFNKIFNELINSNIFGLFLSAFGCNDEDANKINELFKEAIVNKYNDYVNAHTSEKHDECTCDECRDECRDECCDEPETTYTHKQRYCEYVCNEVCYNAAQSEQGYTPNSKFLSTDAMAKLHDITRGYFIDSFQHTKDDYIVNTSKKELRGLYDTLFDFAAHIYNK